MVRAGLSLSQALPTFKELYCACSGLWRSHFSIVEGVTFRISMDVQNLSLNDKALEAEVAAILSPLVIDKEKCRQLVEVFESELDKGLKHGLAGSSLQMENTFIPELLDGSEKGKFLALDLGGTNFRVILLELENGKIKNETIDYYSVEESLRCIYIMLSVLNLCCPGLVLE